MTSFARAERDALCDLFLDVGPDAPTLCAGWQARDLAAHLRLRETSPLALGILAEPLAGALERKQRSVAARDFATLVEQVRRPPRWSPSHWDEVDRRMNLAEYFVHHEDVRRAQPQWEPRKLTPGQEKALWAVLRAVATGLLRRAPVGVVLRTPTGREVVAKDAEPSVVIAGDVAELVLFAYGRTEHARVERHGDPATVAELEGTTLGF